MTEAHAKLHHVTRLHLRADDLCTRTEFIAQQSDIFSAASSCNHETSDPVQVKCPGDHEAAHAAALDACLAYHTVVRLKIRSISIPHILLADVSFSYTEYSVLSLFCSVEICSITRSRIAHVGRCTTWICSRAWPYLPFSLFLVLYFI